MTDPRIGRVVGDRFHIKSRIGEGGMGTVYLAEDRAGGGEAAVKFLHSQFLENEDFVARFRQEARSAGRFRHEHAVRILSSGDDADGVPYIAMEYCRGRSLKATLRDEAPFSVGRACRIAQQMLLALAEAHKNGIVHRDLKPENIRVESGPGPSEQTKVLDFGVAKFIGTEEAQEMTGAVKTRTGVVFGTPKYMAPEQILGEKVDGRSDIYAAGAILYEMLTGSAPFTSDNIMGYVNKHLKEPVEPPSSRAPDQEFPEELEKLVLELLEKNRVARPARAAEVAEALSEFLEGEAEETKTKTRVFRPAHLAVLAGGILGGVLGAVVAPQKAPALAIGAGLGVGALVSFLAFPRVSDRFFWVRLAIVTVTVGLGMGVSLLLPGGGIYVSGALALGAIAVFALYSLGWGRRSRILAFVLAGLLAPLLVVPLLSFPGTPDGYVHFQEALEAGGEALGPALVMASLAFVFSLSVFVAPLAARGGKR